MTLLFIFHSMIYSSIVPYIKRKDIAKVSFLHQGLGVTTLIVIYKEDEKMRERSITFHTRDFKFFKEALVFEKLPVEEKEQREYLHFVLLAVMFVVYIIGKDQENKYIYLIPIMLYVYTMYFCIKIFLKSNGYKKYLASYK